MENYPHEESCTIAHICEKCKEIFTDIESLISHKNASCVPNISGAIKLSDCMETTASDTYDPQGTLVKTGLTEVTDDLGSDTQISDHSDAHVARGGSPIVHTVMLTSGLVDMPADSAGTFINDKGESLRFVVLRGHQCSHCSKCFNSNAALTEHANVCPSQTVDGTLTCPHCHRLCKTAESLKKHVDTHGEERPYVCTYENCTFSFKTKGSLVRHERRHTNSRPFKCDLCCRAFRESGALARHRKSRIPCNQKRDTELPNYGKNMPLPGQPVLETDEDPLESHLLSEFLVPELGTCKDSELFLEPDRTEELLGDKSPELDVTKVSSAVTDYTKGIIVLNEGQREENDHSVNTKTIHVVHNNSTASLDEVDSNTPSLEEPTSPGIGATNHQQQPVPVTEYFTSCQMCGEQFTQSNLLKEHLKKHLSTGSFLCDLCAFVGSRQAFTAHTTHSHSASEPPNTELMTSEILYQAKSLESLRTVTSQQAVREAILIIQQLLILDNVVATDSIEQVKEKVLTLKGIKKCPVCDKDFRSPSYLRHHIRVHTGERPYKCKLCPKDFPTKDTFKKHMLCHSNDRSFKCGECGKLFKRITHAKEHLRIHSNDRPYTCNICKKSFKTATIFKVHARTHTLHMPWVCKICSKRFREKASLTRHVRVHTGDRPFKCGYCDKQFAEHGTLSRHLRAKVPCSTQLAEARRPSVKAYPAEEQIQTIVITEDGDIACPTVLTEFSAVVTDTQEYMPPQSETGGGIVAQTISASDFEVLAVDESGRSGHGTYYIIDGEVKLAYPVPTDTIEQRERKGDEIEYEEPASQYVYLHTLGEGEHNNPLGEQTNNGHVILMEDSSQHTHMVDNTLILSQPDNQ